MAISLRRMELEPLDHVPVSGTVWMATTTTTLAFVHQPAGISTYMDLDIGPERLRPSIQPRCCLLRDWSRPGWQRVRRPGFLQWALANYYDRSFVEFETAADLKTAVEKLDGREFKGVRVTCIADVCLHEILQ